MQDALPRSQNQSSPGAQQAVATQAKTPGGAHRAKLLGQVPVVKRAIAIEHQSPVDLRLVSPGLQRIMHRISTTSPHGGGRQEYKPAAYLPTCAPACHSESSACITLSKRTFQ
eukprot:TRINITY_DN7242_c0_g1_i1.p1 TRINITY_DN7242_c0_g1~~TRINITY_DN7242_c0_g1_i1.p1  ORF type:complete len:113 (-),score=13.54 TRINITY_DN7242_c0_g1_i1:193-531(-)